MGQTLPYDYQALTGEGKRRARIAACTPFEGMTPEQFADSYEFFVSYYLCRDPDSEDVAEFYPPPRLPSPPLHRELIADLARYQKHLFIHPRYFGKSILFSESVPLWLAITNRKFSVVIVCSNNKNTQRRLGNISQQILHNPRIIADFGNMKPARGDASWSQSNLNLINGSSIFGAPITSKLHGLHPDYLVLDDIEGDCEDSSLGLNDPVRLRAGIERSLFRTLLPTLRPGKVCVWIGTTHDRSTLIWHAYESKDDPRWKSWNKDKQAVYWDDEDGERHYLWPEMYTPEFIEAQILEIGRAAFQAEFMNQPASDEDRELCLDDTYHLYWATNGLPISEDESDPLESRTTIEWNERFKDEEGREQQRRCSKVAGGQNGLFSGMYRVLTCDWGREVKTTADYSCIAITGIDSRKHWWLLDLWLGRVPNDRLVEMIYSYGRKWRVQVVGVEAASIGKQLNERVYTDLVEARDWPVRVRPIKYASGVSKSDRISSMQWRFTRNYIHFPGELVNSKYWTMLHEQIENYTPDLKNLTHDDAIDTLSMVNSIYRTPPSVANQEDAKRNVVEMLRSGKTVDDATGISYLSAMDPSEITDEMVRAMRDRYEEDHPDERAPWKSYGF